jgi:hypothetical protein
MGLVQHRLDGLDRVGLGALALGVEEALGNLQQAVQDQLVGLDACSLALAAR